MGVMWLVVVLMAIVVPPASPCSCVFQHPQQHVCEADFVVFIRVQRVTQTSDGLIAYKVKIKRLLKASEKVKLILQKGLIYTDSRFTCEMDLQTRTSQVITGNMEDGKPLIYSCNFARTWKSLSRKMKKGFRFLYERGCNCTINSCYFSEKCHKDNFSCAWETSREQNDCQGRHAACLQGADGTCDWHGGRLYRTCMNDINHNNQDKRGSQGPLLPGNGIVGWPEVEG